MSSAASEAYGELIGHVKRTSLLGSTLSLLQWDMETMMPPSAGAAKYRGRQIAQLAALVHGMRTDRRVGDWLAAYENDAELTADPLGPAAVNLREVRREFDRAMKLPAKLVEEFAAATARAHHAWLEARRASDYARFRPHLERVIELNRRRAECWGAPPGGEPWDALAKGFEPGMRAAGVEAVFDPLRRELRELVGELMQSGRPPGDRFARTKLPIDRQRRFVREVAAAVGFDFQRGRLDESAHPFCQGFGPDDVRMTCRFREDLLTDALSSALHESGHGLYDQHLPGGEHTGTPMGRPVGLTIHESQSRLIENHIGRGRPFWRWCYPKLREHFGQAAADLGFDDVYGGVNIVRPTLIRVEADEATYHLHILVRFELERAMIGGALSAADLPAEWGRLYRDYLGVEPPDDARGCLQDIHWAHGDMGYFPTYTLGSMHAAQLFERVQQEIADLDECIERGNFAPLVGWLAKRVHSQGMRYRSAELCRIVTGRDLTTEPLLSHLRRKLRPIYGL